MLTIRTNVASLNAQRNLYSTQMQLDSSLSRLSSGYRITKAGDDAAGLGISVNLEAQIRSFGQAARNANDGISVLQVGEGAMNEVSNILTRLRELSMESASDGVGTTERGYIQKEADQLLGELDRINATTAFNGNFLFGGAAKVFQVGTGATANDQITVDLSAVKVDSVSLAVDTLKTGGANDLATSAAQSQTALSKIDAAMTAVSGARATLGAVGNRFNSAVANIQVAMENVSAANSRIRDVDVAEETSRMSRSQILMQAGISVLAQANSAPGAYMKLISG